MPKVENDFTTTSTVGEADDGQRSGIAAGLSRALALRHKMQAAIFEADAESHGATIGPDVSPNLAELMCSYRELAIEWATEPARTALDAVALIEFAGQVVADRMRERMTCSTDVSDDDFYAIVALAGAAEWLRNLDWKRYAERQRRAA